MEMETFKYIVSLSDTKELYPDSSWVRITTITMNAAYPLAVDIERPRKRVALAEDPRYLQCRKAVIDFLYTRQAHVEKATA